MSNLFRHAATAIGTLLLLQTFQVALESAAIAWAYNGQILPPYAFYPTQIYDFVAKVRFFISDWVAFMPQLPGAFLPTGMFEQASVLFSTLLPMGVSMSVLLGLVAAPLGFALSRGGEPKAGRYMWLWILVGLAVHTAYTIPPLQLQEDPTWNKVVYRSRSLVLDGTVVALAVFFTSTLVSALCVRWLSGARYRRAAAGVAVVLLLSAIVLSPFGDRQAAARRTPPAPVPAAPTGENTGDYNVILISIDSLRADHVGCYGYERDTTPAMDKLAREGVRFANAVATSSWTLPTHLSMFTSRYQVSHGVMHESFTLSPDVPTLGETMKAAGYATAGFVSAPYVAAHYGYARGMDVYRDLSSEYGHRREARSAILSQDLTRLASEWMETVADERFFLFLHNFDAHYDYTPPSPYDTMFVDPHYDGEMTGDFFIESKEVNRHMDERDLEHILALYDGEIRYADDHIGKLMDKVDELGLRDKTLVLVVSDHGDEFFEHGNKGHHRTLYEEVLRIPMIMRLPDGAHAGTVVEEPSTLVDLMPTIVDVTGVHGPAEMQGVPLTRMAAGRPSGREAVYSAFLDKRGFNLQVARRTPETKVIQHLNRITHPSRRPVELYDLGVDPTEGRDIVEREPERALGALDLLAAFLNDQWAENRRLEQLTGGTNRVEIDDDTMEALKALGYVGD